jgi:hypothetical protein
MERDALSDLEAWKGRVRRKPLIIRGARQVGKTTLVRLFARRSFDRLVEINFERNPELGSLFASKDPRQIVPLLELHSDADIEPGRVLVFLDEIQAAPEVLATLRYFYEEMPQLHVVAAGSLLELALEQPAVSVPVGRLEYLHLGPMRFGEFLRAAGKERLARWLGSFTLGEEIAPALHEDLLGWVARFLVVGGMPDAVRAFVEGGSYREAEAVKHSVLSTFRDDFGKYGQRADITRLRKVFERLPRLVGQQVKYVHLDREERARDLAVALHLLTLARVARRVHHTAANGVPLGAEADERKFKLLFLDVGLVATATGLSILDLEAAEDLLLVHRGALCEQFVGQHLLYAGPSWEEPRLYYWQREKRGSAAEVDYVLSLGPEILPVEVKAGTTGQLRSLHQFLAEKKRSLGLRLSGAPPSILDTTVSLPRGGDLAFRLLSLPLYLVGEVRRLCRELGVPTAADGDL